MGYQPISEYGVIGNDDRCALVDSDGSIDWCCFPSVASPSVFARLLDDDRGGQFSVQPTDSYESEHGYVDRTNILRTTFETDSGRASLTDFMPVGGQDRPTEHQWSIYRHLRCEDGRLTVEVDLKPRLNYAQTDTTVETEQQRFVITGGDERLYLQAHGPIDVETDGDRAYGTATLEAGDDVWFVLQYDHFTSRPPESCAEIETETIDYWHNWVEPVEEIVTDVVGDDPWLDAVIRSGLVLKLLINEGTGAIYAAATTSLPEQYGGSNNWDYRFNWIRDAKFTVQALYNLGQEEEARQYFDWFREVSHEDPEKIQPLYGVHGEHDLPEQELEHLDGYRFSSPVRIGNAATDQRQLDIYGTIVQGLYETLLHDAQITQDDWESIRALVDHVCDVWDEPGDGIWEFRSEPRHYVHSKLLCWVAVDRGIKLASRHEGATDVQYWREQRAEIRTAIEERGYSESAESFVQHFETDETIDASSLLIPVYEFLPPDDPRVQKTINTVMDELLTEDGLVQRTKGDDARPEGHGTFVLCSFWLVDALVLADRVEEAREIFTNVLVHMDPPYLLSERIDPRTGEFLGNFPQAFSHIGLINSAVYLSSACETGSPEYDPQEDRDVEPLFRS